MRSVASLLFLVLLVLVSAAAEASPASEELRRRVYATLNAEARHEEVLRRFAGFEWKPATNPELMIEFCWADFQVRRAKHGCNLAPASPRQVRLFADALWSAWSGRARSGHEQLVLLAQDPAWRAWALVGHLVWALHTENLRQVGVWLDEFEAELLRAAPWGADSVARYKVLAALSTSDWETLDRLLVAVPADVIVRDPDYFGAQGRAHFIAGRRSELQALLAQARPTLGRTTTYRLRTLEAQLLLKGIENSNVRQRRLAAENPSDGELLLRVAYADLLGPSERGALDALERIRALAQSKRHEALALFEMATALFLMRQPADALRLAAMVATDTQELAHYALYDVLQAWEAVYVGDLPGARAEVNRALAKAPSHFEANWLCVLIAKQQDAPEDALRALGPLTRADPYNENLANLALHFSRRHPSAGFEMLLGEFAKRERYFTPSFRKTLRQWNAGR